LYVHGKGGNFYSGPGRFVPELTHDLPITHLSLNMDCHDLGYTRYDQPSPDFTTDAVPIGGGFWEDLERGHLDLKAGVNYLRQIGAASVFIVGHSSGGFYAVDYADRYADVDGLVLLSPLTTNLTSLASWFPEASQLDEATAKARLLVEKGRGHHLISLDSWYFAISAASLLQRVSDSATEWQKKLSTLTCPTLMIWGALESRHELWLGIASREKLAHVVLADCDHHFAGNEDALAQQIVHFVTAGSSPRDTSQRQSPDGCVPAAVPCLSDSTERGNR
jgi:pimeloyl-ACP methyl ester carboxylesterase